MYGGWAVASHTRRKEAGAQRTSGDGVCVEGGTVPCAAPELASTRERGAEEGGERQPVLENLLARGHTSLPTRKSLRPPRRRR